MKSALALAGACLLASLTVLAQQPATTDPAAISAANIEVASAYLAAYSSFDPQKMAPFLAEDAVFEDLTSTNQNAGGGTFVFVGKQAILQGLGEYAAQYRSFTVNYDIERRFESNGLVVFIATLGYKLETPDGQHSSGSAPVVTVIAVKEGKVTKHIDYYDYNANAVEFTEQ